MLGEFSSEEYRDQLRARLEMYLSEKERRQALRELEREIATAWQPSKKIVLTFSMN